MIDIHILELLASKICHDLISPIGAVNNGIEFLEEMGPDALDDATDLIGFSAAQASAKLKAYRLAYGAGGADSTHKPETVYEIIQGLVGNEDKVTQDWDPKTLEIPKDELGAYPTGFCKILTSTLLLSIGCLPRGGTLKVYSNTPGYVTIEATGTGANMSEDTQSALLLKTDKENLHPKVIGAYVCGLLVHHYRHGLDIQASGADCVSLTLHLPA